MVSGLPPVGCLPITRSLNLGSGGGCVADQNAAAERYNAALQQMLTMLEAASPGATLAYVDVYTPLMDMVTQPQKYGEWQQVDRN
jgi:phospholipase/lecithinase/hemolysin